MKTIVKVKNLPPSCYEYFAYMSTYRNLKEETMVETLPLPENDGELFEPTLAIVIVSPLEVDEKLIESGDINVNRYVTTIYRKIKLELPEGVDEK